jgi:hypothetical protein
MEKSRFSALMVCLLVVGFLGVSCDGGSSSGKSAFVGRWYLIEGDRNNSTPDDVELLKDGTGFALDQAITWKIENDRIYFTHPYLAVAYNYKLSGSILDLSNDKGEKFLYMKLGGISTIVGTWEIISILGEQVPYPGEDKKDFFITFNKDGTIMEVSEPISRFIGSGEHRWTTENDLLYIIETDIWTHRRDVIEYPFKIKGDILKFTDPMFGSEWELKKK